MTITALSDYRDSLAAYKPSTFVPDTAQGAAPSIRPLTASEMNVGAAEQALVSSGSVDATPGFGEMVSGFFKDVNTKITDSDRKTADLMIGKTHDTGAVVASVEEANLALQFANAVHNKLIASYQTLTQMQY